jgi:hypothetical protein
VVRLHHKRAEGDPVRTLDSGAPQRTARLIVELFNAHLGYQTKNETNEPFLRTKTTK